MKRKRVVYAIAAAIVLVIAALVLLRIWDSHEITGTLESVQPPICTQNINNPTCGDGVITIRTEEGITKEYRYSSDRSDTITSLQKGTKIQLIVSQGKITKIGPME